MIKEQEKTRRGIVSIAAMVWIMWALAVSPAFGDECVIVGTEEVCGNVDGFDGDCTGPGTTCNAGSGFVGVFGWATATTGVQRIEILVESVQFPGTVTNLGMATNELPLGTLGNVGWAYNINSPLFANGEYDVWARVVTEGGNTEDLDAKQVLFTNNQFVLRPFGEIERPGHNEDVFGTCDRYVYGDGVCEVGLGENCLNSLYVQDVESGDCVGVESGPPGDLFCCGYGAGPNPIGCDDDNDDTDRCRVDSITFPTACNDERRIRYTVVNGWALDLGLDDEDTGIAWVELETNGALVGNTRTSCVFDRQAGGLTNCYGLPRTDVEVDYPFAFDAPSAGYRFALDVGAMLLNGTVTLGSNELTVRAGDWSDQFEDIDNVSVNFLCAEDFGETPFGEVEVPSEGRLYSGTVEYFQGWALDGDRVAEVRIYIDGTFESVAQYGAGLGTRPLVEAEYPGFPDTNAPVWRLEDFDTTLWSNGFHSFLVQVIDVEGDSNFLREVTFRVDNTEMALRGLYKAKVLKP